jgi:tRNA-modifying protein YgfZ
MESVIDELTFADRSDRAKLRVSGPQSAWFLDQILTQSIEDMAPGEARDAALITVHGRLTGYMEVIRTADAFLIHLEPGHGASVASTLERYILATRVEIDDVTTELGLVLVVGPGWRAAAETAGPVALQATASLGVEAGYVWVPAGETEPLLEVLEHAGGRTITEGELESIRIAHGVARWGRDMDEKTFPQEAGVDGRAVHYDKGCYLGQEAMAKIHFRGKVNRRLARLSAQTPVTVGSEVSVAGATVGKVTSAADGTALALLRYTVEPGTRVTIGDTTAEVVA